MNSDVDGILKSWWSLDRHICSEIYYGVKALREEGHTVPQGLTQEKWHAILKGIEDNLHEYVVKGVTEINMHDRYMAKQGIRTFAEYLGNMWD